MLAVITAGIFFAAIPLTAAARAEDPTKLPQPTTYVSDFAGVVDADSKQQIEALCTEVYEKAHATIEVVTIQSLDGMPIENFATQLEDKWKVGAKGTDKGVLLIVVVKDHKWRIEVGYGLEGILNDAKVGDIGRSVAPQLHQGQYGPGLLNGAQQVGNVIAADANVTLTQTPQQQPVEEQPVPTRSHGFPWFKLILFLFFLLVFARGGGRGGGWLWFLAGNMLGGGGGGRGNGDSGFGGGGGGGSDFGGGFGGGSGGGGASGDF
jgi:uncharacterized protein